MWNQAAASLSFDLDMMKREKNIEREIRRAILSQQHIVLHAFLAHKKERYIPIRKEFCFAFRELPSHIITNHTPPSTRTKCIYNAVFASLEEATDFMNISDANKGDMSDPMDIAVHQ